MELAFADYLIDSERRELRRDSAQIALEPQVFDLLLYLVQNRDRVVTKDDLIAAVWDGRIVSDSTLTSRINAARRAIGDSGAEQALIKTYARKGIRFIGTVRPTSGPEASAGRMLHDDTPEAAPSRLESSAVVDRDMAATAPGRGVAWAGRPTVAVLPFKNLSGDPEQEYFSDGITEDIITALSKHRSLVVIGRNSTFTFKGAGSDIRHVGLSLGAEYIVEGSVRKLGHRVRITAQLVETEGGRHLWAERYDRDLQDLFTLQDEITTTIARGSSRRSAPPSACAPNARPRRRCMRGIFSGLGRSTSTNRPPQTIGKRSACFGAPSNSILT